MLGLRQFSRDIITFMGETLEFFRDKGNLRVFGLLVFIVGLTTLMSAGANGPLGDEQWASDWLQNFSTEMLGAVVTFVLFTGYIESRQNKMAKQAEEDQRRIAREAEEEAEKQRLILQMGSPFNEFAVEAGRAMYARGWGFDEDESLHEANLDGANLQKVMMLRANLQGTYLRLANLQASELIETNLRRATLVRTNLQGTRLVTANLQDALLADTNLQGAVLTKANLQGAMLGGAKLDETTTLPDGSKYDPEKGEEQLERFTNPEHPDFWRPEPDPIGAYPWWYKP